MYFLTAESMPDFDYMGNFVRVITFHGLFAVLLAIILICTADIIVRMIIQRKANIPGVVSALMFIIIYFKLESINYF